MGFDNKYPYTDFHEINLDWLLAKVKGIDDRFVAIEEKVAELREDLDIQTGRIDAALDAITFIQNHYPAMIASQYDESRQYDPGEIAIYDNELYIALPGETPGPWNGNYWNKTSLGDELGTIIIKVNDIILPDLTNINNVLSEYGTLFDDIVEVYNPDWTYYKNTIVKYEDHIYMVMADSTTNPPTDTADWDPITLANVISFYINKLNIIIPEFQDNVPYRQYDYVRYNNFTYYLKEATFTGPWDPTKWENCVFSQQEAFHDRTFYDMFGTLYGWFTSFDDAATYNKGDVVNFNGTLYECIADNVTGAWDASKWQIQKVTDAMTDVNTYYKNFPVNEVTGNPLFIENVLKSPAKSLIVKMEPVQEGSGTPSPINPRPFIPWNSVNAVVAGKNLFDVTSYPFTDGYFISGASGSTVSNVGFASTLNFIPCDKFKGATVTLNKRPGGNNAGIAFYSSNDSSTFISGLTNSNIQANTKWTLTIPENANYFRFTIQSGASDIQIEFGTMATTYQKFVSVNNILKSFTSCYGGYIDFTKGLFVKVWEHIASYNGETITEPWLSSIDEYVPNTNPSTGAEVVYMLDNPVISQISKADMYLLAGYNSLWTNGTGIDLEYYMISVYPDYASGQATKIGTFGNKDLCEFIYTKDGLTPSASMTITTGFNFTSYEVNHILSIDVICYDTVGDTYESVQDERVYLTNTGDLHIDAGAINNTMDISVVIRYVKQ